MRSEFEDNPDKLYTHRAIAIASFWAGPIAAGALMRRNFVNMGKPGLGMSALFISIIYTILIVFGTTLIPTSLNERVIGFIFNGITALLIYNITEKYLGEHMVNHALNGGQFYSNWRVAGVSLICVALMVAGIIGITFLTTDAADSFEYDRQLRVFEQNETKALRLYTIIENEEFEKIPDFITNTGIPAWQDNLRILDMLDQMNDGFDELKAQNELLREYCNKRIEVYQLIGRTYVEDTDEYRFDIEYLHEDIQAIIDKL